MLETALLQAPFWCTKRVESAHFDWRWRERPALALLAWETCSRSADEATPHPSRVNWIGDYFRPRAITYRDIAASAVIDRHIAHSRRRFDVLEDCFFDHASAANPCWLRRLNHGASIDPA